ncbi:enoyl-CoA hydratase/isomerase family protein, partial [Candidatus Poribacteria bacterium]|nr:enoyl-CoA hydratase/isomerase family protein [Candidatus Poribacteria bacterium]
LGGGGSATLQIDAQGKTYAHALLRMPMRLPAPLFEDATKHWGPGMPPEVFEFGDVGKDGSPGRSDEVLAEREGRILHLRLNRPGRRNALTLDMVRHLREELRRAASDRAVKVVLMSGAGSGYCAGLDLKELHDDFTFHGVKALAQDLAGCFGDLLQLPQPLVIAVHGSALGGGTALTIVGDCIWAHTDAAFGFPEVKIGFVPGLVSTIAMRRLPASAARELMLSGRRVPATEAHARGWVHHLCGQEEPSRVVDEARAYAENLVRTNSDSAMRRSKLLIGSSEIPGILADMQNVVELFASYSQEESFKHGLDCFFDKTALDWSAE